ncbi:TPA: hypothetical protein ACH3X1_016262 [Trebouxia sp. C0004]
MIAQTHRNQVAASLALPLVAEPAGQCQQGSPASQCLQRHELREEGLKLTAVVVPVNLRLAAQRLPAVELENALHYDITDKLWDGEYVTLEADAAVAPIGSDEDAAEMDLQQMLAWQ